MSLMLLLFTFWFFLGASVPLLALFGIEPSLVGIYANIITVLSITTAAIFCLWTGQALKKDALANVWLLLGLGLLFWGMGQGVYTYYVLRLDGQDPPYPSLADAFFLLMPFFTFVAFLLLAAQWSLRRVIAMPVILGTLAVLVLTATLAFGVRGVYWEGSDLLLVIVDSLYVLPDALMVAAAAFAAFLLTQSHRQWWWIVAGTSLMYLSNLAFTYFTYQETYQSGSLVDSGWIWTGLCFALGAFYSRDRQPLANRQPPESQS